MNKHTLTLMGGVKGELRVSAAVLHETVGALVEGARHATRFVVEGESARKGPRPSWLDAVCAFTITGLSRGSAVMTFEAPTLQEADAARFGDDGQGSLFEEPGRKLGDRTAVDLFGEVLATVVEGDAEDVLADRALLDTCVRFAGIVGDEFEGVELMGLRGRSKALLVTPNHILKMRLLRDETPIPQAVRVSGILDTISASRSDVVLTLNERTKVPARLEEHDAEVLKKLFGTRVVVSGIARFRPSGALLLLDVESIGPARDSDSLFQTVPIARKRLPVVTPLAQDETSGVCAFFDTWPGDETEGELLEALQAIG